MWSLFNPILSTNAIPGIKVPENKEAGTLETILFIVLFLGIIIIVPTIYALVKEKKKKAHKTKTTMTTKSDKTLFFYFLIS